MIDQTAKILDYFEQINAVPRCSKSEAQISQWLWQWAIIRKMDTQRDNAGNIVIRIPASNGFENAPGVVIQGHMDMVCEKTPESNHNFNTDPIVSHTQGEWLKANGTTLGADNGIAIAYMLLLAESSSLPHPALELLFTVDEETGLNGAKVLQPDFIKGRILINLDSEDEGVFTIGCAGGMDSALTVEIQRESIPNNARMMEIIVGGLKGGHSGIDIHKHRANANKIMARTLAHVSDCTEMGLISLNGGSRKNAIARDARAVIWVEGQNEEAVQQAVNHMEQTIRSEFLQTDSHLLITLKRVSDVSGMQQTLSAKDTEKVIQMLLALPHGVAGMSPSLEGLVETSSNLATIDILDHTVCIVSSQRSATMSRLAEITDSINAIGKLSHAVIENNDDYPAWQPNMASHVLKHSQMVYRQLFDKDPVLQVIHAGLECAIIGNLVSGMDMISLGPTIRNPHSPNEKLYIPSIEPVWRFLTVLLTSLGHGQK